MKLILQIACGVLLAKLTGLAIFLLISELLDPGLLRSLIVVIMEWTL